MATSPAKFDGEQYNDWSKQMKALLKSKDLWDVVVEDYQEAEKRYKDFVEKNASALLLIQQNVGESICPKISSSEKAKDAWEILQKEFKHEEEIEVSSDWVIDIKVMLGCLKHREVKACSISRVPEKLRTVKEEAYSPKVVSIGPFHHGTGSDSELQLMEETKWRHMYALLRRAKSNNAEKKRGKAKLQLCSEAIKKIDPVVRASYGGEIKLKPEELARMMIVDGCFILELLVKLYDHVREQKQLSLEQVEDIMKTLSDLTMLENQIPFVVLKTIHRHLSQDGTPPAIPKLNELAQSLFGYYESPNSSFEVFHFLHLMHLSSVYNDNESDIDTTPKKATQELKRCARRLQASGIKIQASPEGVTGIAPSKFVDKFDLNIKFDEYDRTLTIPPLQIKKGTEVKWRNLIAWEQSGIGMGYKFTSYAFFFKGLICSFHDIKLLKALDVIKVDSDSKIRDEELLALFKTITNGVQKMDSRYSQLCKRVNAMTLVYCLAILNPRMWWHYCRRVVEWLHKQFKIWILDFKKDYMPNPWVFIGVLAATFVVFLTAVQTYYAAFGK